MDTKRVEMKNCLCGKESNKMDKLQYIKQKKIETNLTVAFVSLLVFVFFMVGLITGANFVANSVCTQTGHEAGHFFADTLTSGHIICTNSLEYNTNENNLSH